MQRIKNLFTISNIIIFILFIICILLSIFLIFSMKNKPLTLPSNADIQAGLENTFKDISNLSCNKYTKVTYENEVYKYTCIFDYSLNSEVYKEYESCVDCMIKDNKWTCSISSTKCFK